MNACPTPGWPVRAPPQPKLTTAPYRVSFSGLWLGVP